jgi:hypothetical protein
VDYGQSTYLKNLKKRKKKTLGEDGKIINTICWKWLTLIEGQIGDVGGDALRPKP